ncbi:MAG: TerC family protein [Phycisphaerales bacterium]|nr:TerC family protein [Phycisphaerales bacterium]
MEIVLGIDNIVFLSILAGRLPPDQARKARQVGLLLAMVARIGFLFAASWLASLEAELFSLFGRPFSGRDIVLILGGLFLVYKATHEIHKKLESPLHGLPHDAAAPLGKKAFTSILGQIVMMDLVFSIDSVITAVGMTRNIPGALWIMITAIVVSIGVMLAFAGRISAFVDKHPTVKMLALSFLLLIGVMLLADGFGQHIPRGFIYFAMAFSLGVEVLNMIYASRRAKAAAHA